MTNIIGDIAGEYNTLMALLDKMPEGEVISVGDMVDRGLQSKEVIDFFMKNGRAVLGNHEHLMLDHCQSRGFYGSDIWIMNGGYTTLNSYGGHVPPEVLTWIESLPLYIEIGDTLITHAFLRPAAIDDDIVLKENCDLGNSVLDKGETTIIWNRREPVRRNKWKLQVCGHNSQFGLREWRDEEGMFAVCLDDSRHRKLTGLHLETMTIYQQDYLDE